jgi:hypothetical protein
MSTIGHISVRRPLGSFDLIMSHDGSPDCVLKLLASLGKTVDVVSADDIKTAYLAGYGELEKVSCRIDSEMAANDEKLASWSYLIYQDGTIEVRGHTLWFSDNSDYAVDPMLYLRQVVNSSRPAVAQSMLTSLLQLKQNGFSVLEVDWLHSGSTVEQIKTMTALCFGDCEMTGEQQ